jgi:hypothetical protein
VAEAGRGHSADPGRLTMRELVSGYWWVVIVVVVALIFFVRSMRRGERR